MLLGWGVLRDGSRKARTVVRSMCVLGIMAMFGWRLFNLVLRGLLY
jgi:hypothetical protein